MVAFLFDLPEAVAGASETLAPPRIPDSLPRESRFDVTRLPPGNGDGPDGGGGGGGDGWSGEPSGGGEEADGPDARQGEASRFALLLAMIGISTLFAVFLVTWLFLLRPAASSSGSPELPLPALLLSTLVLLASSVVIERALARPPRKAAGWVAGCILLALGFLSAQGWVWWSLAENGVSPSSGSYGAIFYALTGLHAVHVAAGAWALYRNRRTTKERLRLCAVYWHFMGALWLVIFGVLTLAR